MKEIFSLVFPSDHYAGNFFISYYPPPPPFKTSHGQLLNNDRPGVRFINTWDLQLLFRGYGFRESWFLSWDLILISTYSPSFKSTYLGPSKSKYAWVFSSLDFTKKLSKQKITIWLIDNLLIPVTIFNTSSLEPHLRAGKVFAWSTMSLLTIYENNPEVVLSLEKEGNKKSPDEGEYIWARKTNFLFSL